MADVEPSRLRRLFLQVITIASRTLSVRGGLLQSVKEGKLARWSEDVFSEKKQCGSASTQGVVFNLRRAAGTGHSMPCYVIQEAAVFFNETRKERPVGKVFNFEGVHGLGERCAIAGSHQRATPVQAVPLRRELPNKREDSGPLPPINVFAQKQVSVAHQRHQNRKQA